MSNDKKNKSGRAGQVAVWILVILAFVGVAVLLLKQDDCFPDPEPEPVPCKGSHCPVVGEATTGGVIVNPAVGTSSTGSEGAETSGGESEQKAEGAGADDRAGESDAVPSK